MFQSSTASANALVEAPRRMAAMSGRTIKQKDFDEVFIDYVFRGYVELTVFTISKREKRPPLQKNVNPRRKRIDPLPLFRRYRGFSSVVGTLLWREAGDHFLEAGIAAQ